MNELLIRSILPALSILDVSLTYWRMKTYKGMNPKRNMEKYEMNALVRFLWKKFGLKKGSLIGGIFFFMLVTFYAFYFNIYWICFALGIFSLMNIIHIGDISILTQSRKYQNYKRRLEKNDR